MTTMNVIRGVLGVPNKQQPIAEEHRSGDDRRGQIEIRGPGGLHLSFKGTSVQALLLLLLVLLIGSVTWFFVDISRSLDDIKETQAAVIYVLSIKESEREKLKLLRPKSLKEAP